MPDSETEIERTFITVHRGWKIEDKEKFYKETGPLIRGIAGRPYPWKQDAALLANFPALAKSPPYWEHRAERDLKADLMSYGNWPKECSAGGLKSANP